MYLEVKNKNRKPATQQDYDYPNILMLLGLANHPLPPANEIPALKAIIDFRNINDHSPCNKFTDSNYYKLITQQLKNCQDVTNLIWHAPEVACIPTGGERFVRHPHVMVELTKGYKVFIEIISEGEIDEKVVGEVRCLVDELPSFGIKYLVVTLSQLNPCQYVGAQE